MSPPRRHVVRTALAAAVRLAAVVALAAVGAARTAVAQVPPPPPARPTTTPPMTVPATAADVATLLLGARLLAGPRADEIGKLPGEGWDQRPARADDGTVAVRDCVVDPAAQEWLTTAGDQLQLVHRTRGPRWQRPLAELGGAVAPARALLHRDTVVLPFGAGGLLALSRATGTTAWQVPRAGQVLLLDGELVFALETTLLARPGGGHEPPRLRAFAVRNGARAFDVEAPARALRLRAAAHGVALVAPDSLAVFDRGGPELFRRDVAAVGVAAHARGWYVLTPGTLLALDRSGRDVWQQPVQPSVPGLQEHRITTDAAGRAIVTAHAFMADAGALVVCRDAADGTEAWHVLLDGLGIGHSKYWHEVHTFVHGDALAIVSHGAGGQWVELLDPASGDRRARHVFTR